MYEVGSPLSLTMVQLEFGLHMEPTSATPNVLHSFAVEFLQIDSLKPTEFFCSVPFQVHRHLDLMRVFLCRLFFF